MSQYLYSGMLHDLYAQRLRSQLNWIAIPLIIINSVSSGIAAMSSVSVGLQTLTLRWVVVGEHAAGTAAPRAQLDADTAPGSMARSGTAATMFCSHAVSCTAGCTSTHECRLGSNACSVLLLRGRPGTHHMCMRVRMHAHT